MSQPQAHWQALGAFDSCPFSPAQTFDRFATDTSLLTLISDYIPFTNLPNTSFVKPCLLPSALQDSDMQLDDNVTPVSWNLFYPLSTQESNFGHLASPYWAAGSYRNSAGDLWPDLSWWGEQSLTNPPSPDVPQYSKVESDMLTKVSASQPTPPLHPGSSIPHQDTFSTIYYTPHGSPASVTELLTCSLVTTDSMVEDDCPIVFVSQSERQWLETAPSNPSLALPVEASSARQNPQRRLARSQSPDMGRPREPSLRPVLRRASQSGDLRQAYRSPSRSSMAPSNPPPPIVWTPELEHEITIALLAEMERRGRTQPRAPLSSSGNKSLVPRALRSAQNILDRALRSEPLGSMEPSTSAQLAFLRVW